MTDSAPGYDAYSGVPSIGAPGRAATELAAGRPCDVAYSADHELSAGSFPGVEIRAASIRGLLHRYREQPRQDRYSLHHLTSSDTLLVSVCDGVGSLDQSHDAALFVARWMPDAYAAHGAWPKSIADVNEWLGRYADEVARNAAADAEPHTYGMATTFVGVALELSARPRTASIAWTDDSTVWLLDANGWTKLTDEAAAAGSGPLHHTSVRALPHPEPRFHTAEVPAERGALFVMTDGVGVPLESGADVREALAEWWATPPDPFTFGRQVGFARRSHMDDRTVVGIWFDEESSRQVR
ncbi:MAG TPA: protein phosphatase 2C domain-containing protein [Actinospica sp.]|jgi:hypothetical protein|nr:protein phosphatase 2C domain-containing protein [Actinospica sp.]